MSVLEAAAFLGQSETYVYPLLRQGRLSRVPDGRRIRLSGAEVERARQVLMHRAELRSRRQKLEESGKTVDAARKDVYRAAGPGPKI
jgi:excisionase family DNA binding protein